MTNLSYISQLIELASLPLCSLPAAEACWPRRDRAVAALLPLLARRNGFYAFDGALHVFPLGAPDDPREIDIRQWNELDLWRGAYSPNLDRAVCFAEDIFGEQFCLSDSRIVRFNPETGDLQDHSLDLEAWAERILTRCEFETGALLARVWQKNNGPLSTGRRLLPSTPFVLGGDYAVENLFDGDAVEGMRFRSDLALQVRDVPDGALVRFVVTQR